MEYLWKHSSFVIKFINNKLLIYKHMTDIFCITSLGSKRNARVSGQAMVWFHSYLSNRSQSVVVENSFELSVNLDYEIP